MCSSVRVRFTCLIATKAPVFLQRALTTVAKLPRPRTSPEANSYRSSNGSSVREELEPELPSFEGRTDFFLFISASVPSNAVLSSRCSSRPAALALLKDASLICWWPSSAMDRFLASSDKSCGCCCCCSDDDKYLMIPLIPPVMDETRPLPTALNIPPAACACWLLLSCGLVSEVAGFVGFDVCLVGCGGGDSRKTAFLFCCAAGTTVGAGTASPASLISVKR